MKKVLSMTTLFLLLYILLFPLETVMNEIEAEAESAYKVIPNEAIRLRILANSDREEDQNIKRTIRDQVNKEITKWVKDIDDIETARTTIQERLKDIEQIVEDTLADEGIDMTSSVEYGSDVNFPAKIYGSYIYPAGQYEAILITLGEGKGANWWCVLFPPLCFLDFGNGTSVAEPAENEEVEKEEVETREVELVEKVEKEEKEVEVKFFLFKWFS
ncbi:stage II sporulation protein R [Paraliobacillus quinghaiensis]|uniref:Stage II sporulation protein R n=1 Tax=Paraliobacillus quinghaiensis TaxID=470815 RepID=A0A917TQ04_9BACI|nr:stage II sporulation protein R [Paraliobacillus quinghaiensis]GGM32738.1 stage II sporulation protein R [Paraliobacillus quinghaiensis]